MVHPLDAKGNFMWSSGAKMEEFVLLVRDAHLEYLQYTSKGMVERTIQNESSSGDVVPRQSLDSVLQEVDDSVNERAMEVANQVMEATRKDTQETRDQVSQELQDLRSTLDKSLDTMARREDLSVLTSEVNKAKNLVDDYVRSAENILAMDNSSVWLNFY